MKKLLVVIVLVAVVAGGFGAYRLWWNANFYTVEKTDVNQSKDPYEELNLVDDRIEDKNLAFDEALVDSRPYEDWQINLSAAILRLDCPDIRPDHEPDLLELHKSYKLAEAVARMQGLKLLPSANMIDGAAKQFDDGLYATLDLACFEGELGFAPSAVDFIEQVFNKLPSDSAARPFLAAGLQLADRTVELQESEKQIAGNWIADFEAKPARSKPISFYTWSEDLRRVWKFFRFFQHQFATIEDPPIPQLIWSAIKEDDKLRSDYQELVRFYSSLTNPPACYSLNELDDLFSSIARPDGQNRRVTNEMVCVFPPSTSKDTELFNRMFASRPAAGTNLMVELVKRIRAGEVDLSPREDAGWYEHQVFALETLLLPERGAENDELLLTAKYKRRLLQAFEAMITKRRETHARQLMAATDAAAGPPPDEIVPRLRIEPCATYYLRTARSYSFLREFLNEMIGPETLAQLHGLRASGPRAKDLLAELAEVIDRNYGFYLITCEDIGMAPALEAGEIDDPARAYETALAWLDGLSSNQDLSADTRVSVPVLTSQISNTTRLWATIGVRLSKLEVSFATPPRIRPDSDSPWQEVERYQLGQSNYVIAVDEFAEIELSGNRALTRKELRDVCDQYKTKAEIVEALSKL